VIKETDTYIHTEKGLTKSLDVGFKDGRLTIIRYMGKRAALRDSGKNLMPCYMCLCECGSTTVKAQTYFYSTKRSGRVSQCRVCALDQKHRSVKNKPSTGVEVSGAIWDPKFY